MIPSETSDEWTKGGISEELAKEKYDLIVSAATRL